MANNSVESFIARWKPSQAAERANYQLFLSELCDVIGVSRPNPTTKDLDKDAYVFERDVEFRHEDGSKSLGRIDLYKRGAFVLEAKQSSKRQTAKNDLLKGLAPNPKQAKGSAVRDTAAWDDAMLRARGQAEAYAKALPEGWPPFLLVVDVANVIEVWADFSGLGKNYIQFPDASSFRIWFDDLAKPETREFLARIWTDPQSLDPSKRTAKATREIAIRLADLARSLEAGGNPPQRTAEFLMRCLFTMFAEDVGLLPPDCFRNALKGLKGKAEKFKPLMQSLWADMDKGGFSPVLQEDVLRFNGGLFADSTALPLSEDQLKLLIYAAEADWRDVEPAIFGTLLERALDPEERHRLGAHFTPRAYVERLVVPTVIEPLRADWDAVKAAAVQLANGGDLDEAAREVRKFHEALCAVTVLDPACGTGNFLYVALEHLKRIEGEVIDLLANLGEAPYLDALGSHTVDPHQLLGIEVNPRAAAIAELVLWIGYLQWHFKTRGKAMPAQPVLQNFKNIEHRDAVLAWSKEELVRDERGVPVTKWDGRTYKHHPTTGESVPDENARIEAYRYSDPVPAAWPKADFIIGNPPFIGGKDLRAELGDGYAEALWAAYPDVPPSADFVMYWWHRAALEVADGRSRRFGFITTNSISQAFSRRVIAQRLGAKKPVSLHFAIEDHPWVDGIQTAAVRIALTVGVPGIQSGRLLSVVKETPAETGEVIVEFSEAQGTIHADLRIGANVAAAQSLRAGEGLCSPGVKLHGAGFIVTPDEARDMGLGRVAGLEKHIRPYVNGRDLAARSRGAMVIDLFGLTVEQARDRFPDVYQRVLERVKPERDQNNRESYRKSWWVFGEPRRDFRPALDGLGRYIATIETAKHRVFQFIDGGTIPDNRLVCFASSDGFHLGVLQSHFHQAWALEAGGTLEDRPVYTKSMCFDVFPFPACTDAQREVIRKIANELDAHRKARFALHPDLELTKTYNVLVKVQAGEALDAGEKSIHERALVALLAELHDRLDAAVADAYGWPKDIADEEILARVVALNAARAEEERRGKVLWLRPEYQVPRFAKRAEAQEEMEMGVAATKVKKLPWPKGLPEQVHAIRAVLGAIPASPDEVARRFSGVRKDRVGDVLATLASLGQARVTERGRYAR
jgi:hypothetical protein